MAGYTLPDGVTLKNSLGAQSYDELERAQFMYVEARLIEIRNGFGPAGSFDKEYLKALHQHLFQDVFEWAGHTRDERVRLSDGSVATEPLMRKADGQPFRDGPEIGPALDDLAARLQDENHLKGLSREDFANRAADVMSELNGIHPFREGNGRTQRAFVGQLAQEAGHNLDFSVVSQERMIQASIAANDQNDPEMMRRMFREISDPSRVEQMKEAISFFERQGFDWNDRYLATTEPGRELDAVFVGRSGDNFLARTNTEILVGNAADLPSPQPERGAHFTLKTEDRSRAGEGLHVVDSATGAVSKLGDFIMDFLAGAPPAPEPDKLPAYSRDPAERSAQRHARAAAQREGQAAENALESIREDMQAGRNLKAEDIRSLTRQHQEQIRTFGDSAVREMVDTARKNDERFWRGDERDRDR